MRKFFPDLLAGVALWLTLVLVYFLYTPGLEGTSYYDDAHSLDRLKDVYELASAFYFTFSGDTGPLGRPLSLVTFVQYAPDWASWLPEILTTNILLHLVNGALVAWLTFALLSLTERYSHDHCTRTAIIAAALWLLLPINVSTTLIPIQRMASLSAFFVLAGLLFFLKGLQHAPSYPKLSLTLQLAGLIIGTALAALSKESGFLLVLFALVIELTLLKSSPALTLYRKLRLAIYFVGALIIASSFLRVLVAPEDAYVLRVFSLSDRLISQSVILWDYLRLTFIPRAFSFSPFHDAYPVHNDLNLNPFLLLTVFSWPALALVTFKARTKFPLLSFSILWFLIGHLLESTFLPLELYFEHRNYVPLIGVCIGVAHGLVTLAQKRRRLAIFAGISYFAMISLVLLQTTSLWGNRMLAAEIWYMENPLSPRAAQNLAIRHNEQRDPQAVIHVFKGFSDKCPSCISSVLQSASIVCSFPSLGSPAEYLSNALTRAPTARFDSGAPNLMTQLYDYAQQKRCDFGDEDIFYAVNTALLANPRYSAGSGTNVLHYNIYRFYLDKDEKQEALRHLKKALFLSDPNKDLTGLLIELYADLGNPEAAHDAYLDFCNQSPLNPALSLQWKKDCIYLEQWLSNALSANSSQKPGHL